MVSADLVQFCFAGITMGATYGLVAVGFNIIFNATGALNFAQGEFAMLGGMLIYRLLSYRVDSARWPPRPRKPA